MRFMFGAKYAAPTLARAIAAQTRGATGRAAVAVNAVPHDRRGAANATTPLRAQRSNPMLRRETDLPRRKSSAQ
jgi:hypothetical protein